jgi:hypothetical protein
MAVPAIFAKYNMVSALSKQKPKYKRLMLGTDGLTDTGKTEFLLSAPGPSAILAVDCSYDGALDNPFPPESRGSLENIAIENVVVPTANIGLKDEEYTQYFKDTRSKLYSFVAIPELRTVCIDGDSDLWALQLLAEFGRIDQIHPLSYPMVYGMKRHMTKRLWDSGKIIIATHKLKDAYEDVLDSRGHPTKDAKGKNVQVKINGEYKRQGFNDQDYLWQIQIRHLFKAGVDKVVPAGPLKGKVISKGEPQWGLRIMKCKPNKRLEGDELWGDRCNLRGLIEHVYPDNDPAEWGF